MIIDANNQFLGCGTCKHFDNSEFCESEKCYYWQKRQIIEIEDYDKLIVYDDPEKSKTIKSLSYVNTKIY